MAIPVEIMTKPETAAKNANAPVRMSLNKVFIKLMLHHNPKNTNIANNLLLFITFGL